MNPRHAAAIALVACHLALVVCGAAHWRVARVGGSAGQGLGWYAAMSGADSGYGFFAPGVASRLRARFVLSDDTGRIWTDTLDDGPNREVCLRQSSILFTSAFPDLSDRITASWAATMFGRHSAATQVVVQVEYYVLPTLAQYQAGERPQWQLAYATTFRREQGKSLPKEDESCE